MSYQQKASRAKPCVILFLIDDSESMSWELTGSNDKRFNWVEIYIGVVLRELLQRSTEFAGDAARIKPRYFVHVLKYGSNTQVWGNGLMDIETAVRLYTDAGEKIGLGGRMGGTNAKRAFEEIEPVIRQIAADPRFVDSFPPLVFHITDGESQTDASPIAASLKNVCTNDGNVLVLNAYIGTETSLNYQGPEEFPGYKTEREVGPNSDNLRLFEMSSEIPAPISENLVTQGVFPRIQPGARLFFDVRTKEMLKNVIQVVGSIPSRMAH